MNGLCPNCNNPVRNGAKFCATCGAVLNASAAPVSGRLAVGQILNGRYRIVRSFRIGGMGAIYLVEDADAFGRHRVLKEMLDYIDPADYSEESEYKQAVQHARLRFEEEARTLAGLKHRGIPDITAYFSESGRNYIAMEYIEGADLERKLTHTNDQGVRVGGQPYPIDDVIRYGIQICRVLEYLAGLPKPVIHQDIKPANVIVDPAGEVRLVDFGTAQARLAVQPGGWVGLQKSSVYGTIGYAPPEQYNGQSDPRSDVYALGATLYHLATDDDPRGHPFSFPELSTLPQELGAALDRALQQDIAGRPRAAELRVQLEALLTPQSTAEPFHLRGGTIARDAMTLAQACDQHWEDGKFHLYRGDFEAQLRKWGRADLEAKASAICKQHANQDAGLDAFIRMLDPAYPPPRIQTTPIALDLGVTPWGERRTVQIEVRNIGRGCLQGRIVQTPPWLNASQSQFAAHDSQILHLVLNAGQITPHSQTETGRLDLEAGPGGQAQVILNIIVPEPRVVVNPAMLNLGAAYQGETRTGTITVGNQGGSPCEVTIADSADWTKAKPDRFRCEPGQNVVVDVVAETSRMRLGTHRGTLVVRAVAGNWTGETGTPVVVALPWMRTFVRRYSKALAVLGAVLIFLMAWAGIQFQKQLAYNQGQTLLATGQWEEAAAVFVQLGDYRDARAQVLETHYQAGKAHLADGQWELALAAFDRMGDYRDAKTLVLEAHYQIGQALLAAGQWEQALAAFDQLGDYRDTSSLRQEAAVKTGLISRQVYVPAGEFLMGSTNSDSEADDNEKPQHTVYLDAFWIDHTEVTSAQYHQCVTVGQCTVPSCASEGDEHPVSCVSWQDAVNYCQWAGRRLPTEAEWEKAARGADGRLYPWGDNPDVRGVALRARTAPVGSYPDEATPYGILDMAGNVWEWVNDWYDADYYQHSPENNPTGPTEGQYRVMRGGAFNSQPKLVRVAVRFRLNPDVKYNFIGFRCAHSE